MMTTTPLPTTTARKPGPPGAGLNPWLSRAETLREPELLTVADLAECCCPELCDRDHDND